MRRVLTVLKRTSWYLIWAVLGFVVAAAILYIHSVRSGPNQPLRCQVHLADQ